MTKQVQHKNKLFLTLFAVMVLAGSLALPVEVKADSYSNEDNRKTLSVDKKLRSVWDSEYVDNISSSTRVFAEDGVIEFKIKIWIENAVFCKAKQKFIIITSVAT